MVCRTCGLLFLVKTTCVRVVCVWVRRFRTTVVAGLTCVPSDRIQVLTLTTGWCVMFALTFVCVIVGGIMRTSWGLNGAGTTQLCLKASPCLQVIVILLGMLLCVSRVSVWV